MAISFLLQTSLLIGIVSTAGVSVLGVIFGIKNFAQTFLLAHKTSDLDRYEGYKKYQTEHIQLFKNLYEIQPAKLLYFYDTAWYVMKYVNQNVWQYTHNDASKVFNWAKDRFRQGSYEMSRSWLQKASACLIYAAGIGTYIGGIAYYVVTFAIVSIFLVLQFVFTIIGAIVTSVLMFMLGIGTYLFGKFYSIYYRCPECHAQMKIPTYTCNKCNQDHTRLWPSIYGVFYHTCRHNLPSGEVCNNSLPTLDILGRDKLLSKRCPSCNHPLQGVGGTNAHIPIVGSRDAGKSRYTVMATRELIEEYAPANNLEISFPNKKHREAYAANIKRLKSGVLLDATRSIEGGAKGSNLEITKSNQAINNLLYLYDTAGEDINSDEKTSQQETYFKYVHGILLVIDPFKISQVYETYRQELDQVNINPDDQNLDAIFGRVLDLFERVAPKGGKNKFSQPFAVVVNKTDLCDLEQKIGYYAAREYMAKNSTSTNEIDAINTLVEEFLNENGERNFVTNLRSYFSNVRFFSCSAVGSPDLSLPSSSINSQTNAVKGIRVLEPMLWLMEKTKTLPNKASLGAKIFRSKIFVNYGITAITSTFMLAVLGGLGYTFNQYNNAQIISVQGIDIDTKNSDGVLFPYQKILTHLSSVQPEMVAEIAYKSAKLKHLDSNTTIHLEGTIKTNSISNTSNSLYDRITATIKLVVNYNNEKKTISFLTDEKGPWMARPFAFSPQGQYLIILNELPSSDISFYTILDREKNYSEPSKTPTCKNGISLFYEGFVSEYEIIYACYDRGVKPERFLLNLDTGKTQKIAGQKKLIITKMSNQFYTTALDIRYK